MAASTDRKTQTGTPRIPGESPSLELQAHAIPGVTVAGSAPYGDVVQFSGTGPSEAGAADTQAIAAQGLGGLSGSLPYADRIQESFGHHDVSQVKSHVAPEANERLGSTAYATGNDVAFRSGQPGLHTAAHEAAHVVQQREGVHLKDGVGSRGDRYEQEADRVADTVVAGKSAEGLLDRTAGGPSSQGASVQFETKPGTGEGAGPKLVSTVLAKAKERTSVLTTAYLDPILKDDAAKARPAVKKVFDEQVAALGTGEIAPEKLDESAKTLLAALENDFITTSSTSSLDLLGPSQSDTYRKHTWAAEAFPGNPAYHKMEKALAGLKAQKKTLETSLGKAKPDDKAAIQEKITAKEKEIAAKEKEIADWKAVPENAKLMKDEKLAGQMQSAMNGMVKERRANQGSSGVFTEKDFQARRKAKQGDKALKFIKKNLQTLTDQGKHELYKSAADAFDKMQAQAKADGVTLKVGSSIRSFEAAKANSSKAGNANAVASWSSHCLGLAVDLSAAVASTHNMGQMVKARETSVHKWMIVKGPGFGWYPYHAEPWHFEYNPSGFREVFQKAMDDYIAAADKEAEDAKETK